MGEARSYSILFRYVKASIPLNLAISLTGAAVENVVPTPLSCLRQR